MEDEKHRCEEALRKSLLNLSALAGIGAMQSLPLDARRHYAAALTLAQALRTPKPLEQALLMRIVGPSCGFEAPQGALPAAGAVGPIRWTLERSCAQRGAEGGAEGGAKGGESTKPLSGGSDCSSCATDKWVRIELHKARRLSRLSLRLGGDVTPESVAAAPAAPASGHVARAQPPPGCAWPRHCSLRASCGSDSSPVFVEVCAFELKCGAGSGGWVNVDFYRPLKSKHWQLHVSSCWVGADHAVGGGGEVGPAAEGGTATGSRAVGGATEGIVKLEPVSVPPSAAVGEPVGEGLAAVARANLELTISELTISEAEIEMDPLQLLHVMQNLAAAAETEAKAGAAPAKGEQAAPEWLSLGRQAIGAGGARLTADEFWASPTHPPVAVLTAEAERLRSQLVGERSAVQLSHRAHLAEARAATEQALRKLDGGVCWVRAALSRLGEISPKLAEVLRERICTEPALAEGVRARCASWSDLVQWLGAEQAARHECRQQLLEGLEKLPRQPTADQVEESGNCAICRSDWGRTGPRCAHCELECDLIGSEELLFHYRRQRKASLTLSHSARPPLSRPVSPRLPTASALAQPRWQRRRPWPETPAPTRPTRTGPSERMRTRSRCSRCSRARSAASVPSSSTAPTSRRSTRRSKNTSPQSSRCSAYSAASSGARASCGWRTSISSPSSTS